MTSPDINSHSYENREPVPCSNDEHKFPGDFYDAAADCKAADEFCCLHCGWSWGQLQARNTDWERRFRLAAKVAEAVEKDMKREIDRVRGERDRALDQLHSAQRNLHASHLALSEMTKARNQACSIADDAAQLRDDAPEWLAKIDEIRRAVF